MVSKEEIKNLAELARINIEDSEAEKLGSEIDDILVYVSQVKSIASDMKEGVDFGPVKNVWREDEENDKKQNNREELIREFPNREGDYLKVKKIL